MKTLKFFTFLLLFQFITAARATEPRLGLGFAYVTSKWASLSNDLKNGSLNLHFEMTGDFSEGWEGGLLLDFLQGSSKDRIEENLNAFALFFQARRFFGTGAITPFGGFGLGFGNYRAWSQSSETSNSISFNKHGSGFLVGLNPELGLRFIAGPRFHLDLRLAYLAFVNDSVAAKVGGWNTGITLGFTRE